MEYEIDADGKWEIQGKVRVLVEPSVAWLEARKAENDASEAARIVEEAAQSLAEVAALEILADPLVAKVEQILQTRGLSAMTQAERKEMVDATVFLTSRGKHGGKDAV